MKAAQQLNGKRHNLFKTTIKYTKGRGREIRSVLHLYGNLIMTILLLLFCHKLHYAAG